MGILIQQNISTFNSSKSVSVSHVESDFENSQQQQQQRPQPTTDAPPPFDMQATFEEMSRKLKEDIIRAVRHELQQKKSHEPPPPTTTATAKKIKQDEIEKDSTPSSKIELPKYKNEPTRVTVSDEMIKEKDKLEMKFKSGEPVVIKPDQVRVENQEKKASETAKKTSNSQSTDSLDQTKGFSSTLISKIKPKKMWIPIPNRLRFLQEEELIDLY